MIKSKKEKKTPSVKYSVHFRENGKTSSTNTAGIKPKKGIPNIKTFQTETTFTAFPGERKESLSSLTSGCAQMPLELDPLCRNSETPTPIQSKKERAREALRSSLVSFALQEAFLTMDSSILVSHLNQILGDFRTAEENRLSNPFARLEGLITPNEPSPDAATVISQGGGMGVPYHVRRKLSKGKFFASDLGLNKSPPPIGIAVYIGSPIDGELVVVNPTIVSDWLSYIREAVEEKALITDKGMITASILSQLLNVIHLPESRHSFFINYDIHPGIDCTRHSHSQYRWRSSTSPCDITSCHCSIKNV